MRQDKIMGPIAGLARDRLSAFEDFLVRHAYEEAEVGEVYESPVVFIEATYKGPARPFCVISYSEP